MSNSPTPPTPASPPPAGAVPPGKPIPQEIKVISHSHLFYWWPVWFFGFLFALWTYMDGDRLAIIGAHSDIVQSDNGESISIRADSNSKRLVKDSKETRKDADGTHYTPKIYISSATWMAPVFFVILFLVIMITNVPLRGLWSLVAIILLVVVVLLLSLFEKWDMLLKALGDLHIFLNLAGYLALSVALFIAWCMAVLVFDRRTYAIFTPGQLTICEEIGGREKVYDTNGLTLEKRRDDWFRHLFLGFGTGDLTIKTSGADRHELILPNVAFIAFKIKAIEQMLRSRQMSNKPT
jgi:hypothetical protein